MKYEAITIGEVFTFERQLTREDVAVFAKLTGDFSPLHVDEEFGQKTSYGQNIVHGMLAASLFSTLVGMYCAGENSVYVSQSAFFKRPLFYNTLVTVRGTVVAKHDSIQLIRLRTEIIANAAVAIDGEAQVKVIDYV